MSNLFCFFLSFFSVFLSLLFHAQKHKEKNIYIAGFLVYSCVMYISGWGPVAVEDKPSIQIWMYQSIGKTQVYSGDRLEFSHTKGGKCTQKYTGGKSGRLGDSVPTWNLMNCDCWRESEWRIDHWKWHWKGNEIDFCVARLSTTTDESRKGNKTSYPKISENGRPGRCFERRNEWRREK